ncbi:MAG: FkbM family methyltransferase [Bacteroidales bacterium]
MLNYFKNKIRKHFFRFSAKNRHIRKSVNCKLAWYGSRYGGFYINPEILNENSIVYSFGIGEDITFDSDLIKKHSCNVFGFDPTPKSISWVKSQKVTNNFHFFDFGLGNVTGYSDFFFPKNPKHISGSIVEQNNINKCDKVKVLLKSINDIAVELEHKRIDVLKMDIEGAEYELIDDILNADISIDQILIEFHDRLFSDGRIKTINAIQRLNEKYAIFGYSDNYEEISFIRRDLIV